MSLEVGDRLGDYEIRGSLGAGGMGTVLRAWQPELGREVAIKIIRAQQRDSGAARFRREMEVHIGLSHPHLVKTYDAGCAGDIDYLVMELLEGTPLAEIMRRDRTLPLEQAIGIARDLTDALAYLHSRRIVHRDLKPQNVMIDAGGGAKLMDLGLAHAEGHTLLTNDFQVVGTVRYLPPEFTRGPIRDPRADMHTLGVVLFEMLTGRLPFRGDDMHLYLEELTETPAPLLRTVMREAPPQLEELVDSLLRKDPLNRPHASEALADLEDLLALYTGRGEALVPAKSIQGPAPIDESATTQDMPVPRRPTALRAGPPARRPPGTPPPAVPRRSRAPVLAALMLVPLAAILAFSASRLAPVPSPVVQLRYGARSVTVVTSPPSNGRLLRVLDGPATVASAAGKINGNSSTFHIGGLRPDHPYRAQIVTAEGEAESPVELDFRTAFELEILGRDGSGSRGGLWIRSIPALRARWEGEKDWMSVKEDPVRLDGRSNVLEILGESGAPATFSVTSPESVEDARLDLGLIVGQDPARETIAGPGGPVPLMDWMVQNRLAWIALPPGDDGRPRLDQDFRSIPDAPRRLLSMTMPLLEKRDEWIQAAREAARRDGPLTLALDATWLYTATLGIAGDAELASWIEAWRSAIGGDLAGSDFLVPGPLGLILNELQSTPPRWLRALGRMDAISLESLSDGGNWDRDRVRLQRGLEKIHVEHSLRFAWLIAALRTEFFTDLDRRGVGRGEDSIGLARCFAFARAAYPGVTVIADLAEVAGPPPARRLRPTWDRLIGVARALRATRFRRYLSAKSAENPRIESREPVIAMNFAGSDHAVQILCTETRPQAVRFTPARPGILRVPGPSETPWSEGLVTEVKPLDLQLTSYPLIYEELVPADITPRTTGAVSVELIVRK